MKLDDRCRDICPICESKCLGVAGHSPAPVHQCKRHWWFRITSSMAKIENWRGKYYFGLLPTSKTSKEKKK